MKSLKNIKDLAVIELLTKEDLKQIKGGAAAGGGHDNDEDGIDYY